jgi:hypothetical protein
MFLVLCSHEDLGAQWAFQGLRERGLAPIELFTAEQLAFGRVWEHRVGAATPSIRFTLADGRTVCSSRVSGVLNRLLSAPQDLIRCAQQGDRDYAQQELASFYLSWLQALPGVVINRPTPQGFCGRWRHTSEWAVLAQRAGLPAPPYRQSVSDGPAQGYATLAPPGAAIISVVVLKNEVFGQSLPAEISVACCRFAALAECELMGISLFQSEHGSWLFSSATPYPDLQSGGEPLLAHLTNVLGKAQRARPLAAKEQRNRLALSAASSIPRPSCGSFLKGEIQ